MDLILQMLMASKKVTVIFLIWLMIGHWRHFFGQLEQRKFVVVDLQYLAILSAVHAEERRFYSGSLVKQEDSQQQCWAGELAPTIGARSVYTPPSHPPFSNFVGHRVFLVTALSRLALVHRQCLPCL